MKEEELKKTSATLDSGTLKSGDYASSVKTISAAEATKAVNLFLKITEPFVRSDKK